MLFKLNQMVKTLFAESAKKSPRQRYTPQIDALEERALLNGAVSVAVPDCGFSESAHIRVVEETGGQNVKLHENPKDAPLAKTPIQDVIQLQPIGKKDAGEKILVGEPVDKQPGGGVRVLAKNGANAAQLAEEGFTPQIVEGHNHMPDEFVDEITRDGNPPTYLLHPPGMEGRWVPWADLGLQLPEALSSQGYQGWRYFVREVDLETYVVATKDLDGHTVPVLGFGTHPPTTYPEGYPNGIWILHADMTARWRENGQTGNVYVLHVPKPVEPVEQESNNGAVVDNPTATEPLYPHGTQVWVRHVIGTFRFPWAPPTRTFHGRRSVWGWIKAQDLSNLETALNPGAYRVIVYVRFTFNAETGMFERAANESVRNVRVEIENVPTEHMGRPASQSGIDNQKAANRRLIARTFFGVRWGIWEWLDNHRSLDPNTYTFGPNDRFVIPRR